MHEAYTALSDKDFQHVVKKLIFCRVAGVLLTKYRTITLQSKRFHFCFPNWVLNQAVCKMNVCYEIYSEMKKTKAQEGIKKYFLKPVVNNSPNFAAANANQTEKTTPIQSQSNEHTLNETSAPTPSVLQLKPNHPSSSFTFPKRNYGIKNCSC